MGGAKFCRFALFPLMLLMLLLLPGRMVAQTEYDTSVTLKELAGNPVGYKGETYANLFDGKKENGNFSKWCCEFRGSAYVIFEASKAVIPVGYTITTGNDNANPKCGGRNPLSWKLYGNNEGKDGAWTLIDEVNKDKVLQDKNNTSYDFKCECSTSYKYFKWEISAIHSGSLLQVGEFELKLNTCTHLKADGSSALGAAIKTVEPTCTEHGYTTKECSLCHLIVKEYLNLKPHTLTHHALKAATCTEAGIIEYWQCNVCNKLFSNEAATTEITDAANLVIPANGHTLDSEGNCTVCGANRYALFNNLDGITDVTITDNGGYPWQILDSNAEGMQDLGFTIPKGSNGLMSGNYRVDSSSSETVIRFKVSKTILLTSQVIISAEEIGGDEFGDAFSIYLDDKLNLKMRGKKQTEYKVLLSPGEHSLKLKYEKGYSSYGNADRAFLYNLKTSVTMDDYVADYESSNNTLTFKKITSNNIESLDLNHAVIVYNNRTVPDICYLLGIDDPDIKSVVFDKSFNTYAPKSLKKFFQLLTGLETIKDLKYLNTENVTDMSRMFWACSALTSLDLSNFNTAKVRDMREMFYNCKKLSSLDLSNFITTNVTDMQKMFLDCSALTLLDLSNFYTKEVWYMNDMFSGCSALTTIYASDKFVTVRVNKGNNVFKGCTNLKGYDLSKTNYTYANCGTEGYFTPVFEYAEFDGGTGTLTFRHGLSKPEEAYALNLGESEPGWLTHNKEIKEVVFDASFANARPTGSYKWFYDCTNLATIEGFENLNTENMTKMSYMFFLCRNLSSLDLTNFYTGNVTEMWNMFGGCEGLTSLDLTSFNTANVTDMDKMFSGCSTLTTIYVSEKFVTDQVKGYDMFSGCRSLKDYSNSKRDRNYANYKTGYFTKLVGKNGDEKIGATGETLATDNLVLDDDKDFVAYEPFAAKAASYSRTVEGTTWATLCLPFEVSLENQNFRAFKLLSADDVSETVELEEIETSIAAGTPVIIKMKDGANSLSISVADKAIAKDVQTSKADNGNYQLQGLYTQKVFSKDADNNCYIVKGDKLMNPAKLLDKTTTEHVGSKPFRAYMVDNSSAPAAGARMFSISVGGSTTAIEQLETTADSKAEYYDLQGRRLQDLQKGVNIVKRGGKTMKVIIK